MLHLLLMEDHADLLRAIASAEAIAVTRSPHERPDPRILALPVPARALAVVLEADRPRRRHPRHHQR